MTASESTRPDEPAHEGPGLAIEVEVAAERALLRLDGYLDMSTTGQLAAAVADLPPSVRSVVLDLAQLRFIDSTGVSVIMRLRRDLELRFGTLVLANPSDRARFAFEITGLSHLFAAGDAA